jgi:hypothetical protein
MGYRGEDASRRRAERQPPWQSSSGNGSSGAGPWDDGSRGYTQGNEDYGYDAPDTGATAGRQDYGQQEDEPYDGYGPAAGVGRGNTGSRGGYQEPDGAGGYDWAGGYGQRGYDQRGYDNHDQRGYDKPGSGYPAGDGYGQRDDRDYGGYQDPGSGGYRRPAAGGHRDQGSGGFQRQGGGYQDPGSGGHRQQGGYPGQDAGNDWYGRQPAAASGASFADTGTYQLNGRVIDEYGTGPGQVLGDRDPVRGYPPASGPQARTPLPAPAPAPAASGPQAAPWGGPRGRQSGQQDRYPDDYPAYPDQGYGQDGYDDYAAAAAPYDDQFGAGTGRLDTGRLDTGRRDTGRRDPETSGRGGRPGAGGRKRSSGMGKRSLFGALAIFAVAVAGVAAYVFVIKGHSAAANPNAAGAIPSVGSSSSAQAACAQQLGPYCHIEMRTDDPTPLTLAEVFPPEFQDTTDKISYSLAATKEDKTCGDAVIGSNLTTALTTGKCTQVLRASYISGNGKIMGTIGVVNLSSTNQAHYAGKDVGQNDFVAPLDAPKGVASKMDNGTGLVEASFKGHYLILTWSIFVNGTTPSTKAEISELEVFGKDLVAGTVNIPLSQRMVTGAPAVAGTA